MSPAVIVITALLLVLFAVNEPLPIKCAPKAEITLFDVPVDNG